MSSNLLERDYDIEKLKVQANAEIDEWLKTGNVPPLSQDAQDYLNSLIEQQVARYKKD